MAAHITVTLNIYQDPGNRINVRGGGVGLVFFIYFLPI